MGTNGEAREYRPSGSWDTLKGQTINAGRINPQTYPFQLRPVGALHKWRDEMHTPGPWQLYGRNVFGQAFASSSRCIAQVSDLSPETADSNARLITAAPELLEACKSICGVFEGQKDVPRYVLKARAAIKKATD
jgi:hypothetical protein